MIIVQVENIQLGEKCNLDCIMYRYKKCNVHMYNTSQIQIETCRLSDYLDTINMEYLISI